MRTSKLSALFLTAALAISITGHVFAADIGQCGAEKDMKKLLEQAEGQHIIATSSTGLSEDKYHENLVGYAYSKNAEGSVGYIMKILEPLDKDDSHTKICIYDRMTNVHVFNVHNKSIPKSALINKSDDEISVHCKELVKNGQAKPNGCFGLNKMLAKSKLANEGVLLHGDTVAKQPNGSYKPSGMRITIIANIPESNNSLEYKQSQYEGISSVLYTSIRTSATILDLVTGYTEYSKYALSMLKQD